MDNKDFKDGDHGGFSNMGQTILIILIAATVTFFIYTLAQRFTGKGLNQELSYSGFLSMVDRNLVEKVEWGDGQIVVYPKSFRGFVRKKECGGQYPRPGKDPGTAFFCSTGQRGRGKAG